jgi:putative DNA methylase
MTAYASDLNPVAVLINKAMIEIPPKFASSPPANPKTRKEDSLIARKWQGLEGLAEDLRYYGQWMRDEAENRIGHLYPKLEVTAEMVKKRPDLKALMGSNLTVIAWFWTRTVTSPDPAFANVKVPLASTFMLSTKAGEEAYVEPVIESGDLRFTVKIGKPKDAEAVKNGTKLSRGANFRCLMSGTPIHPEYIYREANAGRIGARHMAVVAETERGRVYLPPDSNVEVLVNNAKPTWKPDLLMPENPRWFSPPLYGLKSLSDIFTARQLVALTTFSDLVQEVRKRVKSDALAAGFPIDESTLATGGTGAAAYADAMVVFLSFVVSRMADRHSTLCRWQPNPTGYAPKIANTFGRQALPIVWDYVEGNPFSASSGNLLDAITWIVRVIETSLPANVPGMALQADAQQQVVSSAKIVSTDPPYYDNIGYADLSDFFYVWLRRSLKSVFPDLFATLAVPKSEELIATPYRHGSKEKAESFFLNGMTAAMRRIAQQVHPAFPVTIYYAFKQSESTRDTGTSSTGWETFLEAVIRAGLMVTGTWPIRTEMRTRQVAMETNALASSIVLVCRPRPSDAPTITRREFVNALRVELPSALAHLQRGNIAPVDLAQAAIGPGMAVYTRYASVLDASGKALTVRDALTLINQTLDEALAEQEGDFDADTRWALAWFEQSGFTQGEYGVAETLSKAKNTSIAGMVEAGILASKSGKVRLLRPAELPAKWDPARAPRLTTWEVVHQLIRVLELNGESATGELVANLGNKAEVARELAYRLYNLCERNKRAPEALAYNGLVQSWPEILRLSREGGAPRKTQTGLFEESEE